MSVDSCAYSGGAGSTHDNDGWYCTRLIIPIVKPMSPTERLFVCSGRIPSLGPSTPRRRQPPCRSLPRHRPISGSLIATRPERRWPTLGRLMLYHRDVLSASDVRDVTRTCRGVATWVVGFSRQCAGIRPLSDTVPLWSGSSFGAFVYIGNDGCMLCSWF